MFFVVELDDTSSKGLGKSVLVACKQHGCSPIEWPPEGGRVDCLANDFDAHVGKEVEHCDSIAAQTDVHLLLKIVGIRRVAEYDGAASAATAAEPSEAVARGFFV